jgi:hypothetical protein
MITQNEIGTEDKLDDGFKKWKRALGAMYRSPLLVGPVEGDRAYLTY